MNNYIAIENLPVVLSSMLMPTVTLWNRLEARPRTDNLDKSLRSEVRDPLWMLARQWQMGEFKGDDAGSPVTSKMCIGTTHLTTYTAGNNASQPYDEQVPLEAKVEQRTIQFVSGNNKASLDIRCTMGRQWLKMISATGNFRKAYTDAYGFAKPDINQTTDAGITAHREAWQQSAAVANRCMDGYAFYQHLKTGGAATAGILTADAAQQAAIGAAALRFVAWYEALYLQPVDEQNNAWTPEALEYKFGCSAPEGNQTKKLLADEYYHGHLDWYNVDIAPGGQDDQPPVDDQAVQVTFVKSGMPAPVSFDGMPDTRWWAFEDGKTNFGDINASTTDLGKLLFIEFGLVYANDWFLLPLTLPAGSLAKIKGLSVTNVFGERFWIEAAGKGLDDDWNRWSMYNLNIRGNTKEASDNSLLLLPTATKILEGKPREEVHFIRDEVANMVWGIEHTVPMYTGQARNGSEAAAELTARYQGLIDAANGGVPALPEPAWKADIRYEVMNAVPEHWIPFVPAKLPGSLRSIRLQRAAMPRILRGDPLPPVKIEPRTRLLRQGLDAASGSRLYFIREEEVPRAGASVRESFQRCRWYDGRVVNWLGIRKQTGRGEGHSGLAFDRIVPVKKAEEQP